MAFLEVFQDMYGIPNDTVLKAVTGFEGGVVACGATCGIVTGGAIGIALNHADFLKQEGERANKAILEKTGAYVEWFEKRFGSCRCRAQTGIDFYSAYGQLRYFFPGEKVAGCMLKIRRAARYLYDFRQFCPKSVAGAENSLNLSNHSVHCAVNVLEKIRQKTGIGDDLLETVAVSLDGGVGLSGNVCGALAGAVMGINLLLGLDIRNISFATTVKAFVIGHLNLLGRDIPDAREPFAVGRHLITRFRERAGGVQCSSITGRRFNGYEEFQAVMASSDRCAQLIEYASELAICEIEKITNGKTP